MIGAKFYFSVGRQELRRTTAERDVEGYIHSPVSITNKSYLCRLPVSRA